MADFRIDEALWHDADHFPASRHGGIGHSAHQAHGAPAVHQGQAAPGDGLAQSYRGFTISGVGADAGTAKDTNGTYRHC